MLSSKTGNYLSFSFLLVSVFLIFLDVGFKKDQEITNLLFWFFHGSLIVGLFSVVYRYFLPFYKPKLTVKVTDVFLTALITVVFIMDVLPQTIQTTDTHPLVYVSIFLLFFRELSELNLLFKREYLNPAQLFVGSFLLIIIFGTGLLMLPKATHSEITFIDALFTSTSAVCVTGLIVVDTGSYFTTFGQIIIASLIQIGGIGIMTFTTYFSFFFKGGTSYENHLMLKDILNADKLGDVISMLKKIILLTFAFELAGAVIIFFNLKKELFSSFGDQVFFSVFHSISSFCNAGFSTLQNSLLQDGFQFNYGLQVIVMILFIIGGIGFPIVFNFIKYLQFQIIYKLIPLTKKEQVTHKPWIINLNTRIVFLTTVLLLCIGTALFYLFEYNNTLAAHSGFGKFITALFGAATPRTAGFNTIDVGALNFYTVMIIIFLMWVGASPGSTGGGIKTSTLAVATLNFFSLARGKDRVEAYRREISFISVRRAFAVISLSLVVIGAAVFFLVAFEEDKGLIVLAFEAFSAYSTVGLSMGITGDLSYFGKIVIIFTMFIGRVSMLSILVALLRSVKNQNYQYPQESILIN